MSDVKQKWMSSGFVQAAPTGEINEEKGIIEGVTVCTVGEAQGHGVHLDSEFIQTVAELGGDKKQGLKARYGHPNMCSTALGTFLGRFKNFREGRTIREGEERACAIADLFLSNEAKNTPQGDLHSYITGMAKNEPDMFGTSIVFTPGRTYKRTEKGKKIYHPGWSPDGDETGEEHQARRDEWETTGGPLYVECEELHGCDAVDEPAANEGLFSRFSNETAAGQITEFLDLHPQIFKAITDNPEILEVLGRYGEKIDEFVSRYRAYRKQKKEKTMTEERTNSDELAEDVKPEDNKELHDVKPAAEPEKTDEKPETQAPETPDTPADEQPAGEQAPEEEPEKEPAEDAEPEQEEAPAGEAMSRDEFIVIADRFGSEIATKTMREGGSFVDALQSYADQQKEENDKLRQKVKELEQAGVGTPAKVVAAGKTTTKLFNTQKKKEG
jgi:hypothetical protein